MKKLTRLLLINWHYFCNTIIDFGTINFLTGKNSSGKSTIIDALQVVLMGETRSTAFNRAANNKKSERTLKSYLIGAMGEDVDSGKKSLREGKTFSTYIVAEFYDDYKADYFCLGAVFDSFSDGGDFTKRFFWLRNRIPENRFIEDGKTMNSRRMTQYFKEKYPNKFETRDTSDGYWQIVRTRLNVQDGKFITMLKKAISFEPINDIEKFITENVCDIEDDIDITAMQENIRYYKDQEAIAARFERKLNKLNEICGLYSEVEKLRSRKKIQQFLIDFGTYNDCLEKLDKARSDVDKFNKDIVLFKQEYDALDKHIEKLKEEREQLIRDKEKYRLENNVGRLEEDEERYKTAIAEYGQKVSDFVISIKTKSIQWLDRFGKCAEATDEEIRDLIGQVEFYLHRTEKLSEADFELLSPEYFSKARESYIALKEKLTPVLTEATSEVNGLLKQSENLRKTIEALKNGVKPYPENAETLKKAIRDGLRQKYNKDISVDYFADLIEITDIEWQNAIEGYLNTQRMNIIVSPEYFMDAYAIYKKLRRSMNIYGCAVVDLEKVYNDNYKSANGSLAEIVKTEDKYVGAYVRFLLGRVMRCYNDDKIREHKISITKECMLYKNYAVSAINKDIYSVPYIGRNSIEKQIEAATKQLSEITAMLNEKSKTVKAVEAVVHNEWFITEDYVASTVTSAFDNYKTRNIAMQKLAETKELLGKVDLLWLEEMEKTIEAKQIEEKVSYKEKEEVSNKINSTEGKRNYIISTAIPQLEQDIVKDKQNVDSSYSGEYQLETGIPRYEAELSECGSPSAVAKKFESPIKGTETKLRETESALTNMRSEYNSKEQTSFSVTSADNSEYEEEYNKIKDYELPQYRDKIERAKNEAMEQFKSDFLYKLRDNIKNVEQKIVELNDALKLAQFGNDTYKFKVAPNPSYLEYYNMIMSPMLELGNEGLFNFDFTNKYQTVIDNLFSLIIRDDGKENTAKNVVMFSKYKTYLSFDLLATDSTGKTEMLSKSINTKSGGETQTPFYIAVLASFAQLYNINDSSEYGNTARLVIFDEAFNKMDGERIVESVKLLNKFGLQAIICSPPEKAADIAPVADKTLLVHKEAVGSIYKSTVIEWTKEMSEM